MDVAFYNAVAFDQYIGAWGVSKVRPKVTETVGDPSNFRSVCSGGPGSRGIKRVSGIPSRRQKYQADDFGDPMQWTAAAPRGLC